MKKLLTKGIATLSIALVILILGNYQNVSAESNDLNLDELYEDAKNGISDLTEEELNSLSSNLSLQLVPSKTTNLNLLSTTNTGQSNALVDTYTTAKIIESNEDSEEIAIVVFSDISFEEDSAVPTPGGISTLATGSLDDDLTDPTVSVRAYSTIYVETTTTNGVDYMRLTRTKGGWTILDNQVSVSNKTVAYGTNGMNVTTQTRTASISGMTFDITVSPAFKYVITSTDHKVGATSTAKLTRGGSSWTLRLDNSLGTF